MADVRKEQMEEMYRKGKNYNQIGKEFGISRQRVYQIIGGSYRNGYRGINPESCVYAGLRNYLIANKMSISSFTRKVYGSYLPRYRDQMGKTLKGKDVPKSVIDKILSVTSLTYEQAFGGSNDNG